MSKGNKTTEKSEKKVPIKNLKEKRAAKAANRIEKNRKSSTQNSLNTYK